jgi:hypothetical protein
MECLFDKEYVSRYAGNTKQLFGIKSYTFDEGPEKGVKAFEIDTGVGLRFTVLPDRCLDIAYAQICYQNISYIAKPGIVSPYFYQPAGEEWLRNFGGGLLTTCGLNQVGIDDSGEGLHGRIGNIPAFDVGHYEGWVDGQYEMMVTGKVRQAVLYGENVLLERRITAVAGGTSFKVLDTFTNGGRKEYPLLLLYHCNFGYPLLDKGTQMIADINHTVARDEGHVQDIEKATLYTEPRRNGDTQVFFHDLKADSNGYITVKMINRHKKLGIWLKYPKSTLPCFAQWKNNAEQDYVTALEPCISLPIGCKENLKHSQCYWLAPGETFKTTLELGAIDFKLKEDKL